jgi:segregation and condensation protein B
MFMPKKLIEAALFMSTRPLTTGDLSKITGVSSPGKIEERLEELRREYAGKGMEIVRTPEGWTMEVRKEMLPKVAHLARYSELREGHKRTLALVAYREPVRQSDIVRIQGNKAYSYIKLLLRKGLVKSEKVGRTRTLMLTKEFERYFGEDRQKVREMLEKGIAKGEDTGDKSDPGITEIIPFDKD